MSASAIDTLLRQKILEDIYSRMTDEEKHLLMQMGSQDRSHTEIMQALQQQQAQLAMLQKTQQGFASDFLSNIAGNAVWAGAEWVLRRLVRLAR